MKKKIKTGRSNTHGKHCNRYIMNILLYAVLHKIKICQSILCGRKQNIYSLTGSRFPQMLTFSSHCDLERTERSDQLTEWRKKNQAFVTILSIFVMPDTLDCAGMSLTGKFYISTIVLCVS